MRFEDLVFKQDPRDDTCEIVIARLGVSDRGESSKTGRDQGVTFDSDYVKNILKRRGKKGKPKDRVFNVSREHYSRWYQKAARATKLEPYTRPLHSIRHTGPSRDLASGYRTWEQIKRRGRWQSDEAVMRYTKQHVYLAAMAALPPEIVSRAEAISRERQRPAHARP